MGQRIIIGGRDRCQDLVVVQVVESVQRHPDGPRTVPANDHAAGCLLGDSDTTVLRRVAPLLSRHLAIATPDQTARVRPLSCAPRCRCPEWGTRWRRSGAGGWCKTPGVERRRSNASGPTTSLTTAPPRSGAYRPVHRASRRHPSTAGCPTLRLSVLSKRSVPSKPRLNGSGGCVVAATAMPPGRCSTSSARSSPAPNCLHHRDQASTNLEVARIDHGAMLETCG